MSEIKCSKNTHIWLGKMSRSFDILPFEAHPVHAVHFAHFCYLYLTLDRSDIIWICILLSIRFELILYTNFRCTDAISCFQRAKEKEAKREREYNKKPLTNTYMCWFFTHFFRRMNKREGSRERGAANTNSNSWQNQTKVIPLKNASMQWESNWSQLRH